MDLQRTLDPGTELKRRSADLDFPLDDLKSCKCPRVSVGSGIQPDKNSNDEEVCEGKHCRVLAQQGIGNFHRSGIPSRFLYYEKGHWRDFPQHLIPSFVESFVARKSYARFSLQDKVYVLSFLYMIQVNLYTRFARSIGWIDRNGEFFRPEKCIEQNYTGLPVRLFDGRDSLAVDAQQVDEKSRSFDSSLSSVRVESPACVLATSCSDFSTLGDKVFKLSEDDQDFSFARELLLSGFSSLAKDVSVVQIYKCSHSSLWGHARLQAFKIQEESATSTRGDANVRYAWHGTSKEGIFGIIRHGFGQPRVAKNGDAFGVGVYLAPENASHVSAVYSDVDESGEQHILLCKVIMGRMEQVPLGSQQFHPSSEEYDSGADDCTRPKRYIVWSTHMNTHILPLFVISFKLSTIAREVNVAAQRGKQSLIKESAVSAAHAKRGCQFVTNSNESRSFHNNDHHHQHGELHEQGLCDMQADSCTSTVCDAKMMAFCPVRAKERSTHTFMAYENSCANGPSLCNVPRSPWISFPELFPMLESKLEPQAMNVLQKLHTKFQVGRLPRNLFVKMIRRMLGDDFLRECIKNRSVQTVSTCDKHSFCG